MYVTGPHLITDPQYTSEAAREAAADPEAPEGKFLLKAFRERRKKLIHTNIKN